MKTLSIHKPLIVITIFIFYFGCTHYPAIKDPDVKRFKSVVHSFELLDSLNEGKILQGMPHFVVEDIFKNWTPSIKDTQIPVASIGSKQRLEEEEGWGRIYVDPDIQVFLDKYETDEGILYVWYQFPDFYRMDVSLSDRLCIYLEDTILCSNITCLRNSRMISVADTLIQVPPDSNLFAEIHYNDHPWRKITYWFALQLVDDSRTFKLKNLEYGIYPIEFLEFNDSPITSYKWRK